MSLTKSISKGLFPDFEALQHADIDVGCFENDRFRDNQDKLTALERMNAGAVFWLAAVQIGEVGKTCFVCSKTTDTATSAEQVVEKGASDRHLAKTTSVDPSEISVSQDRLTLVRGR